ncbi:MAG: hypothetical protein HY075_16470 [Deltaproteobacteria bacterium]|nr:hypothetical protein [Deltaproteobacteria bacterium]
MNAGFLKAVGLNIMYATLLMLGIARYNHASDFFVTSVVRELPMKAGEVVYKDYYVNAGTNNGLRKGLVIEAVRKLSAFDNINSKLLGDTPVKIARLKIIHVDKTVSIARLEKFYEKEATPLTGFDAVMIGDLVQVAERQ